MPLELEQLDYANTTAVNLSHDRKYGWHVTCPREYTNIARNPEYVKAVPHQLLYDAKNNEEVHQITWDWHSKQNESVLTILKGEA